MTAVRDDEVIKGIVIHLDPTILKNIGGCEATTKTGHEVSDAHYFLVIDVDRVNNYCIAMPLFSERGKDRQILNNSLKSGMSENWIDKHSYLFRWQTWKIPLSSIERASVSDESDTESRARPLYSGSYPAAVKKLAHSSGVKASRTDPAASHKVVTVLAALARKRALSLANAISIGLKSGL